MIRRRLTAAAVAAGMGLSIAPAAASAASAGSAASTSSAPGSRSLAQVLLADGDRFDRNWYDYDIVTEAVLAVLAAKPSSPVQVLTRGDVPLTAFLPNDRAFQVLAYDLTKRWAWSERAVFSSLVSAVGIVAIEQVLLYHVVPGATIDSAAALRSDGARLATALPGAGVTVDVISARYVIVRLVDADRNDIDAYLNRRALDLNAGNRQIAHGVLFVMRPLDL